MALVRAYVDARLSFYEARNDLSRLEVANAEAARIGGRQWAQAQAASAQDSRSVSTGLFIQALNDVIDLQEKRQVAFDNHVPELVIHLLLGSASLSMVLVGYGCGLSGQRRMALNLSLGLLVALVFAAILDIDRPRRGLVEVSQDSMIRLKATLKEHNK